MIQGLKKVGFYTISLSKWLFHGVFKWWLGIQIEHWSGGFLSKRAQEIVTCIESKLDYLTKKLFTV